MNWHWQDDTDYARVSLVIGGRYDLDAAMAAIQAVPRYRTHKWHIHKADLPDTLCLYYPADDDMVIRIINKVLYKLGDKD